MKKAIVTGATGFIGTYLVKELISHNVNVIAVLKDTETVMDKSIESYVYKTVYCDLANIVNLDQFIDDRDVDVFYHLAWQGSAGSSRADVELQMQNVIWSVDSVKAAKKIGCKKYIGAGSIMEKETISAVYENNTHPGLGYIYGTGKLATHSITKSVASSLGIDHIWCMITNAYGPGEYSSRFINMTLRRIINRLSLDFTSATQNYDFIYVTDVASAFYHIGVQGIPFNNYVIGSLKAKPLKEFILEIKSEIAPRDTFNFGNIPYSGTNLLLKDFDASNLLEDTDFRPRISFREGIRKTFEWLIEVEKNDSKL